MWINVTTGEVLTDYMGPETDEIVFDASEGVLPGEANRSVEDGDAWLPAWYLQQEVRDAAELQALKDQFARRKRRIEARQRYRELAWGERLEARVQYDLDSQKGKAKSVDYEHGRCGWRHGRKVVVQDEDKAIAWAREHAPGLLGYKTKVSFLKSAMRDEDVEECPHTVLDEGDRFYWRV